jgi:D-amino-acid dehydrogenase
MQVTLLDKAEPAAGCSSGNAGWIVPSFATPLAGPGKVRAALHSLLAGDGAFRLSLRAIPQLAGWLMRFLRHCNSRDHQRGSEALGRLSGAVFQSLDELAASGVEFESHRQGTLYAFLRERELQATHAALCALGCLAQAQPRPLRGEALLACEPALSTEVCGGLYITGECHVRPESLSRGLLAALRSTGAVIRERVEVQGWEVRDGRIIAARTACGPVAGEHFVLSAGVDTALLAAPLELNTCLQAGKGYSLTFDDDEVRLRQPLDLVEAGVVCSPFAKGWRLAGTMELSGVDDRASPSQLEALRKSARRYLDLPRGALDGGKPWMGQRPLTPDGLPLIGRVPGLANGYVAAGHAMLGMTLAPVTGSIIADLVALGSSSFDISAFDPGRFA